MTDRAATVDVLEALHREGALPDAALQRALALTCASPGVQRWRRFLDWLLLGFGAALLLVGFILVVAFNWAALPAFVKLALAASLVAGSALAAWRIGLDATSGRVALTSAAVLVGPLLALYGQTYQTGADPWQLFAGWAAFITLWVLIARSSVLWLVQLLLVNVTGFLFWEQAWTGSRWHSSEEERAVAVAIVLFNSLAWAAWEVGAWRKLEWMQGRWLPRTLAVGCFTLTFAVVLRQLVDSHHQEVEPEEVAGLVLLLVLLAVTWTWFQRVRRDLFMLATALGVAMTTATTWFGNVLMHESFDVLALFVLGFLVIGEVGAAAWWLRSKHRAWGQS